MSEQKFNRKNIVVTGRVSYSQIQCFLIFFFNFFNIKSEMVLMSYGSDWLRRTRLKFSFGYLWH